MSQVVDLAMDLEVNYPKPGLTKYPIPNVDISLKENVMVIKPHKGRSRNLTPFWGT